MTQSLQYLGPLLEVRLTHRFATYRGTLDGRPVFVKVVVDTELIDRLQSEVEGMSKMERLDAQRALYSVPRLIERGDRYLVNEWVEGHSMSLDSQSITTPKVKNHLNYLVDLYAFIDSQEPTGRGVTRFNEPGQKTGVAQILQELEDFAWRQEIDEGLVNKTCSYIERVLPNTETRFTHGDLQPENIILTSERGVYLVDFEACSDLWPRHYNIVNLIMQYAVRYPALQEDLQGMFDQYCLAREVDRISEVDAFNVSSAMRSIQIIYEWLSSERRNGTDSPHLTDAQRKYLEDIMVNISSGKLFFGA